MVADKPSKPTSRDEFEIAIVCTRALEYDALCLLFDDFWDIDGDPFGRAKGDLNTYTTGCMGHFNVVAVLLCSSGKATAASATANLRSSYNRIELLLLAGICEGVPNANGEELLLGDVVISETVIEYDLGTQLAAAFRERNTLEELHGRVNKNIRNFTASIKTERGYELLEDKVALYLQQIQSRISESNNRKRRKAATYIYPGSVNDILFESTHRHRHYNSSQCVCADYSPEEDFYAVCDQSRDLDCQETGCELKSVKARTRLHLKNMLENDEDSMSAQTPHIFLGRFGSGDTVFRSGIHRDSLAQKHNIIAFETEGSGVWDELPCIIVKGVSDYGDGHKVKCWVEWRNFAAATAASAARALIERYPQTDKSPTAVLKLQDNKACLNALFITNPADDKIRIQETKGGLLRDVYIWITKSEEFVEWLEDLSIRLLWIKGDPGKGKTMLLCGVIDELKKEPGRDIYYFLCQATDVRLNNAEAILRGLLYMIVSQQPSFITYLRQEFDKSGKSAFEGANSWVVLSRIFEQMLRDDSLKDLIFIIDALDECVSDLAQFLKVITQSSASSSRAKWLVSSRNYADIQETLTTAENKSTVSLELNAGFVSTATTKYIQHQLRLLSYKKRYTKSQIGYLEEYLSANANGTFLWVALVCAQLERTPRFDRLSKSIEIPVGLDQLYERMIDRVCDPSISDFGRRVLAIATVTNRPLTTSEFASMINDINHDGGDINPEDDTWEAVLGYCGSFLTLRNGTIYFVHQSAKDFIVKHAVQRLFPNGTEHVHREILEICISAMSSALRKDMYNLIDPAFSVDDLSQRAPHEDPLISIKYGCVHWVDHFENSMPKSKFGSHDHSTGFELINAFLGEKFIYWVEALSLLGNVFDGVAAIQRLEHLVANSGISELRKRVWDARRFIQTFDQAIADYPLQVYVSALIFSPTRSITRQRFKHEAPKWIHALPNGESEWAPASRTYGNMGPFHQLSVSCCGAWIASASNNSTITVWETFSGKIIRTLPVFHIEAPWQERNSFRDLSDQFCFSPWNRVELASNWFDSSNHQLMIWDITTGKATQQLRIENWVESISYLMSARNILCCLSGSKNDSGTEIVASIWNTETGQMIERIQLQEPSTCVSLLKFSTVNKNIIALSRDHAIQDIGERRVKKHVEIINIDTASRVHVFSDHINEIKFSPDGSLLAVQTNRSKIILSDTASGDIKWLYESNGAVYDIAFSPDGTLLAASTSDGIQILSIISCKCLRTIRFKSDRLIFSPDGHKIYILNLGVVHVVEMDQQSFIEQALLDDSLQEVILSPDCKLVASISILPTRIKLLDIDSNTYIDLLELPYDADRDFTTFILKFSPDSKKLVFISTAWVKLWDVSSKPARNILTQEHFPMITFESTFSPNSARLAIVFEYQGYQDISVRRGAYTLRVQVSDTGSGNRLMFLEKRHCFLSPHFCFSRDSRRLAISYSDEKLSARVEIWDVALVSAIQSIELSQYYLHSHLRYLDSSPGFWSSSSFEGQVVLEGMEEGVEEVEERRMMDMKLHAFTNINLRFTEDDQLTLDLRLYSTEKKETDIRIVLRTRTGLNLTGETVSMLRFKEVRLYNLDAEKTWIEFNGERFVWIPHRFRTRKWVTLRNCMVLSQNIGPLSVIQFRHSELIKQISLLHTAIIEGLPCVSELDTDESLHELRNNWIIAHHDMGIPDDEIMCKIDSFGIKDITSRLSGARLKAKVKYSYYKRKIFNS